MGTAVLLCQAVAFTWWGQHIFIVTRQKDRAHLLFSIEEGLQKVSKHVFYGLLSYTL